jgi:choline dehydrogenase-like flavoprotein
VIIDGLPDAEPSSDVCIIGGGPAGISLALRLTEADGPSVTLLESGGLAFEEEAQELARADVVGVPSYPLHETRIRALGGSSWSWGGICTPLDPLAFEARSWVPNGGWPFTGAATLDPYLPAALELCGISPAEQAAVDEATSGAFEASGLDAAQVAAVPVYFGRPVRFGPAYQARLEAAPRLTVLLHTTATGLELDGGHVAGVGITSRGRSAVVRARVIVLAAGGIENARLLLIAGLGGPATGRFFMDHPRVVDRYRIRPGDTPLARLIGGGVAGTLRFLRLSVSDELQRREGLLNQHVNLQLGYAGQLSRQWPAVRRVGIVTRHPWNESPYYQDAGGGRLRLRLGDLATMLRRPDQAALCAVGALAQPASLRRFLEVGSAIEQVPERDNRVELEPRLDGLGMPRAVIHWHVGAAEERTYRRSLQVVVEQLDRLEPGLAGTRVPGPDPWPSQLVGNWHHEGTTRMNAQPSLGVVDGDCRVHGLENLYVAGSSVFPVSGSTSPTVTIVQLALRLGDYLAARLGAGALPAAGPAAGSPSSRGGAHRPASLTTTATVRTMSSTLRSTRASVSGPPE